MWDTNGKDYARLSALKQGSKVRLDDSFSCVAVHTVIVHQRGERLYFRCDHGHHYLDEKLADDNDSLIGVYHA